MISHHPIDPFTGFPPKLFTFLSQLNVNNNKEWFEAHRGEYELSVREPSKRFVAAMAEAFAEAELPLIASPKASLFRINRDIRFSADKSPYKTHIGFMFPHSRSLSTKRGGMYLGFEPKGKTSIYAFAGGGVYMPEPDVLKHIRAKIAHDPVTFSRLANDTRFLEVYPNGLEGESLIRAPKGYDEEHPAIRYLKMKQFLFSCDITKDELLAPNLPAALIKKFAAAVDMLQFLTT